MRIFSVILLIVVFISVKVEIKAQSQAELVEICTMMLNGATYLKDFPAQLEANPPQPQKFSLILSKDTQYRLSLCDSKDYPGEAILQLYDNNRLLASTYNVATGKDYPFVDFRCQKTGVYHIFLSFKEGKPGLAVGMLSFVKKL